MKRMRVGSLLQAGIILLSIPSVGWEAASAQAPAPVGVAEAADPVPTPTGILDAVIAATRTPVPTAAPDLIAEGVELVAIARFRRTWASPTVRRSRWHAA
jgi:hypothetical protein